MHFVIVESFGDTRELVISSVCIIFKEPAKSFCTKDIMKTRCTVKKHRGYEVDSDTASIHKHLKQTTIYI